MCIETPEKRDFRKINKSIDRELKRWKADARKQVKLLLLGTGESGKSTFMKQMKIIHDNGFSQHDLEKNRKYVFHNTVVCMQQLLWAMRYFRIELDSDTNRQCANVLLNLDISYTNLHRIFTQKHFPTEFVHCVESLWKDKGVQACYERRTEFQLSDSAEYFFTNVSRFGETNYIPTYADIVRIRVPTTGIVEHCIFINSVCLRIVDVGGQDTERLKWINCFEGVTSIIFLTALNEYDMFKYKTINNTTYDEMEQCLSESKNNRVNRMQESLALFRVITSVDLLAKSSFILFLNKKDLLEEKICRSALSDSFPEYEGPLCDSEAAGEFIKQLFVSHAFCMNSEVWNEGRKSSVKRPSQSACYKPIYAHFTCATDTENIKFVFESVKHAILTGHIGEFFFE